MDDILVHVYQRVDDILVYQRVVDILVYQRMVDILVYQRMDDSISEGGWCISELDRLGDR